LYYSKRITKFLNKVKKYYENLFRLFALEKKPGNKKLKTIGREG